MALCRNFSRIQEGPELTDVNSVLVRAASIVFEEYGRPWQGTQGTVTIFPIYHDRIFDLQRALAFIVPSYSHSSPWNHAPS